MADLDSKTVVDNLENDKNIRNDRIVSIYTQEGTGHDIEDLFTVHNNLGELNSLWNNISFYGIFDGHGGIAAAKFISQNILSYITKTQSFAENGDVSKAIWDAFLEADADFLAQKVGSGCCGIAAFLVDNVPGQTRLLIANVGDSRAILVKNDGEAIALSTDHKASNEVEKARIKSNGGFVNSGRLYGILAVARAFGDKDFKGGSGILIAEPEITETTITAEDAFVLIACDGLWDVLENKEVAEYILEQLKENPNDVDGITKSLVQEAVAKGSRDDITVILVLLQPIGGSKDTTSK